MLRFGYVALLLLPLPGFAQQPLSGDEIRGTVSGKTIDAYFHPGKYNFKAYFDPDGKALSRREDRKPVAGAWRISAEGLHCTQWGKNAETCGQIVRLSDGKYQRLENGTLRATWNTILDGNAVE
jgi:hypothetical protein